MIRYVQCTVYSLQSTVAHIICIIYVVCTRYDPVSYPLYLMSVIGWQTYIQMTSISFFVLCTVDSVDVDYFSCVMYPTSIV